MTEYFVMKSYVNIPKTAPKEKLREDAPQEEGGETSQAVTFC